MKSSRVITVCAVIALLILGTSIAIAQDKKNDASDKSVIVADILKKAECPLTEEQMKQLKNLDLSQGRESFQTLYKIFDEKQLEVLKKTLGTRPGRNDRPETPRFLLQIVLFEKAGCPLTEKQLEALKALPMDQSARQKANEIYTDKQKAEMQKIYGNRG